MSVTYVNNATGDTTGVPCCNPFSTIIYPIGPNQSNATTIGINQTARPLRPMRASLLCNDPG